MKNYLVQVPITGIAVVSVEADTEAEAIALAIDNATLDHVQEWQAVQKIVGGNFFYGMLNEADVEEEN